jgi:hypothetical protein
MPWRADVMERPCAVARGKDKNAMGAMFSHASANENARL